MTTIAQGQITLVDLNDAKSLTAFVGSNRPKIQIYDPNANTFNPNWTSSNVVLTPELYVSGTATNIIGQAKTIKWFTGGSEITSGANGYTIGGTNPKALTIAANKLSSATPTITYQCEIVWTDTDVNSDITVKSEIEFAFIETGQNALTIVLSNEAHAVPSDATGGSQNYTGSGTEIRVFEGATELTYDGVGTANSSWKVVTTPTNITVGTLTDSGTFLTVGAHTGMTQDTANIKYTISGKRANGDTFSIDRNQTFSKSKGGSSPTLYRLIPSANAIQQNISNVFNPTTVTALVKSQTGTGTYGDYGARVIIAEATWAAPTTFVDKFTSANTEATTGKVYTPTAGNTVSAIRIRAYIAGTGAPVHGTTLLIDEQVIPIVKDGATGAPAITVNVWTPDGNTVKNATGSVKARADIYSGGSTVAGTAYKWYVQEPLATPEGSNGSDTDGKAGWRLMPNDGTAPTAAPTFPTGSAGGTLPGATYYVNYTWITPTGETTSSPEANKVQTANNTLVIQVPAFPAGVYGAKVYVSTTTGVSTNRYQGTISTSNGTLTINAPISTTSYFPPTSYTGVTGVTTAEITIPAGSIYGSESFKCVATYSSVKYTGVCTVSDLSDPIMVQVVGVSTFKNGEGSTTLTAKLIRAGVEIDAAGSAYAYTWYLYDSANVRNNTWNTTGSKTGKTITVNATDVDVRANIVCEVSDL